MSRERTMRRVLELADTWNELDSAPEIERPSVASRLRRELVGVLQWIRIYDFDAETALVELIRKLEDG